MIKDTHEDALGPVTTKEREEICSSLAPFKVLLNYRTVYPATVVQALGNLYLEYNRAFASLIAANREGSADYQYCWLDGAPANWAIQIDMVGLPDDFLRTAVDMPEPVVREILRRQIFEIENSLAMYQLLERTCARPGQESFFKPRFRATLAALRRRFGKPIALLAVTDQKYEAMKNSEFGRAADEALTNVEVQELSGFDAFFGPREFRDHLVAKGGDCEYLLYARTSDPVAKLKKPGFVVDHPLLSDPELRRVIKANAVTFNVDAPDWLGGDRRRINDTKRYLPMMGMAFPVREEADLISPEFTAYLARSKPRQPQFSGVRLAPELVAYLQAERIDPEMIATGQVALRCKPVQGAYGCYGHVTGMVTDCEFRGELRRNIRLRGEYVVQPEMPTPCITNLDDGMRFTYIDRNFLAITEGKPVFLGGLRSLMPVETNEAQHGRVHGNEHTICAEIVG